MRLIHSLTLVTGGAVMLGLFFGASRTEAASGDADGTYTVTVTKVEVSKNSGTTYTTVFEGSQAINIAAANAGAVAAGLISGVTLEPGSYTTVRVTIGSTMQLKGYVNSGTNTLYTSGGSNGTSTSKNTGVLNTPGSGYAASTYTIPAEFRTDTKTGFSPIQVEAGKATVVDIAFDTTGTVSETQTDIISPGDPTVTITSR
jgi:hypothetical protein